MVCIWFIGGGDVREYRRRILDSIGLNAAEEQEMVDAWLLDSPKNYQIWNHRMWLVSKTKAYDHELKTILTVLDDDAKNYHAWQQRLFIYCLLIMPRQWVVSQSGIREHELDFTDRMITTDLRNNSAWNYRMWLLDGELKGANKLSCLANELKYG